MHGLARKLLIYATADGLLLRQIGSKEHRNDDIQITYGTHKIGLVKHDEEAESSAKTIEVYGLVGLLDLESTSYLIAITQRKQVAQIRGNAIYTIRDVSLIPLSSQAEAEKAIANAQRYLKQDKTSTADEETEESDVGEDMETSSVADDDKTEEATATVEPSQETTKKSSSFAKRWFSKARSTASTRQKQAPSGEEEVTPGQDTQAPAPVSYDKENAIPGAQQTEESQGTNQDEERDEEASKDKNATKSKSAIESLTPRILRTARLYFSWSGFFFSYEHDLSGTLMQKGALVSDLPLWKRFDKIYFWNQSLAKPFIDSGRDELVLPLMQGFVGQRAFSIAKTDDAEKDVVAEASQDPEDVVAAPSTSADAEETKESSQTHDFLATLISRRSVKRAGLRYLRRGVDDDGNVANAVETEQIFSTRSWDDSDKAFSLLQTRGSLPLHFSQSPYSFKPTPVLFGSESTNQIAFRKHFELIAARYRQIFAVSLVDKHGTPEVSIGEAYENHAKILNESGGVNGKQLGFEWFDFHGQCKGMKFENVSILIDSLESTLKSFGWIVKQHDRNTGQQSGVVRSNCMDCLDRTNVVQSAIASWALERQLNELGLDIDLKLDPKTQWFNTLWADNGDAISKQYAGTSALKGDFVRNRKRNWTGRLSDMSLTLGRYYNNVIGDYFLQTCIDYYLGNASPAIFDEFETDMMSKDYSLDMRRIRQNAIDTCERIVLEDPTETLLAGWTLSCPHEANTLRSLPFEECVVLLTNAAFYFCRFDWQSEKVGSFERVDLRDITEIWRGAYITSALGPTHLDESKNVGFALRYKTTGKSIVRSNTRSLQNESEAADENKGKDELEKQQDPEKDQTRLLAFKALPPQSSAAVYEGEEMASMSEMDLIKRICDELQKVTEAVWRRDHIVNENNVPKVEERDVISTTDAKKSTGYMESIGYSLKRLVWS